MSGAVHENETAEDASLDCTMYLYLYCNLDTGQYLTSAKAGPTL